MPAISNSSRSATPAVTSYRGGILVLAILQLELAVRGIEVQTEIWNEKQRVHGRRSKVGTTTINRFEIGLPAPVPATLIVLRQTAYGSQRMAG
jgi:hypothetical protein